MVTMLRITSILLAVIVGLASSNVPAAAQQDLSKSWGDNWAKSCVTDIRQRIQRGGASIPFPLDGAADNCCRNERGKDSKAACNNLSSNDQAGRVNCQNALETCKNEVKTDPGIKADIAKAEEKEREKAAANCKGVAVKDLPAKICCTGSKGTGCVAELVDCERLGGSQVKSGAEPACNKVFPGYTGHVVAVPEIDCSLIKVDTAWTAEKGFKNEGGGKCTVLYNCLVKSRVPDPPSGLCKPVAAQDKSFVSGTCTDAKCTDCKAPFPTAKCTVSFVKK